MITYQIDFSSRDKVDWVDWNWTHPEVHPVAVVQEVTLQPPDAVVPVTVAVAALHQVEIDCLVVAVAVDTSCVAVFVYADVVIVADVVVVVLAYVDAGHAFDDAFGYRQEVDYLVHQEHYPDDPPPPPPGACNSHRQLVWLNGHLVLVYGPCVPSLYRVMPICIPTYHPYSYGLVAVDNTPHFVCPFCRKGEILDMEYLVEYLLHHSDELVHLVAAYLDHMDQLLVVVVVEHLGPAEAPEPQPHNAADVDGDDQPRHCAGPGYTNSQNTNSCYYNYHQYSLTLLTFFFLDFKTIKNFNTQ